MMARTSPTTMQSLLEIEQLTHVGVRRQSVLRFCVTLTQFGDVGNVVNYFNKTKVFFSKPILTLFTSFFGEDPFAANRTDSETVARWSNDWCTNARENFQNLRKWVQSLCAQLLSFRSEMKKHTLLPHAL